MSVLSTLRIVYYYWLTHRRRKWSSRTRLERWKERRVIRHIRWVRANSSFFREHWNGLEDSAWRSFPLMDKTLMMAHFDRLNTAGILKEEALALAAEGEVTRNFSPVIKGITIGLSSGTSGNRGLFLVSGREQDAWTGTVLAKLLPGGLREPAKIAFFLRANSNLYESVRRGKLEFRYFDLLDPIGRLVECMEAYRPTVWVAPPSMLRMLADEFTAGRLTARPSKLISVAEVLDLLDRDVIEQTFGQTVHQAYQCTEGFLGATCELGTLHLNEDVVHIEKEYLDPASRRFVPIVTDFSRTTQPIVRYRLNDVLTEAAEPCACGCPFTAIERIEGRCDDILYFPHSRSGETIAVFPDFVARAVIAASAAIEHYRVVQLAGGELDISLQLASDSSPTDVEAKVTRQLLELSRRLESDLPEVRFSPYMFVPGVTKLRRVERKAADGSNAGSDGR